jgi:hypothetical protein
VSFSLGYFSFGQAKEKYLALRRRVKALALPPNSSMTAPTAKEKSVQKTRRFEQKARRAEQKARLSGQKAREPGQVARSAEQKARNATFNGSTVGQKARHSRL